MIAGTAESSIHIGALLMLMALSVVLGGVMERAGVMELFPTGFTSVWIAMTFLVAVLVLIGMFMEPYGAIILVSATIASIAYQSGIDPVHFWMVVLLAFELGYLTPPIALNQILTRQVVGDEEMDQTQAESQAGNTWWQRHERLVMPVTVMAIALLLVAYVPLALGN
jgi:TRAP-type C4-dicarboxylate transport system permease large subunit